jgi:hypothetical protein
MEHELVNRTVTSIKRNQSAIISEIPTRDPSNDLLLINKKTLGDIDTYPKFRRADKF